MEFKRFVLPGGLRVLVEYVDHVRSVALGIFVPVGSRDEPASEAGVSHFLEHLVFKGTQGRSARRIAEESDALGGHLNAYTTREETCFHNKVLDEQFEPAFDLLADLVVRPRLDPDDVERERQVILEELRMVEDDPEELVHDLFAGALWGRGALGRPVAGTRRSVSHLGREPVAAFHHRHYTAANLVVAVAGHVAPERVLHAVERCLADLPAGRPRTRRVGAAVAPRRLRRTKPTEQAHVVLGTKAPGLASADVWATSLLAAVLGGGTSSRLFQAIREERGLVYDVSAFHQAHTDVGGFGVSLAAVPDRARQALHLAVAEWERLQAESVPEAELQRHRDEFKTALWLGLESSSSRMSRLGGGEVLTGEVLTPEEVVARVEAVTPEHLRAMAVRLGHPSRWAGACVGPREARALWPWDGDGAPLDRGAAVTARTRRGHR